MSREKLTYRDNLVELKELYDGTKMLNMNDIKNMLGIGHHQTITKDKRLIECGLAKRGGKWCITLAGMARYLS